MGMRSNPADHCAHARQQISLRVDSELSEFEGVLLDKHLERCAGCHAFAEGLADTTAALRAAPLEEPVLSIRVRSRRTAAWAHGLRAVSTAAAVALMGVVGLHPSTEFGPRTDLPPRTDIGPAHKLMGLKERQLATFETHRSPLRLAQGLQAAENLTLGPPSQRAPA